MNFDYLNGYITNERASILKAELDWINALSKNESGVYDEYLEKAKKLLDERIASDGALTVSACDNAEKIIMPLSKRCKQDTIMCVSHAHIDMNWVWGYNETVAVTLATYRTMLDLLEEYDDFIFTHSQASTIKIVEDYAPEMLEEIKKYVRAGRWEIIASTWVENDKNLTATESMLRHILYTERYLSDIFGFGKDYYTIDFEPDTFGHPADLPEILAGNGVKYYYHGRGAKDEVLRNWVAPSGKSVVLFREPLWYSGEIEYDKFTLYADLMHKYGMNKFMHLYGVGDHGGGATRRDIERIKRLNAAPCMPRFEFSKMHDFFDYAEKFKDKFQTYRGELNPVFRGCYTSQSRIKFADANDERRLLDSERFIALAATMVGFDGQLDKKAWINHLFNQFHDILPGSCVIESREHAMGLSQETQTLCGVIATCALREIARNIKNDDCGKGISEAYGAGVGFYAPNGIYSAERGSGNKRAYMLVNASDTPRNEPVELQLWDYEGDTECICVRNVYGEIIPSETLEKKGYQGYWYTPVVALCSVPACGYTVVYLSDDGERKTRAIPELNPRKQPLEKYVLDNGIIRATFSEIDGSLQSLINLKTGKEMLSAPSAIFIKTVEDGKNGMTAWNTGTVYCKEKMHSVRIDEKAYNNDGLIKKFAYRSIIGVSEVYCTVTLPEKSDTLKYSFSINYKEIGETKNGDVPGIAVEFFPVADGFKRETQLSVAPLKTDGDEQCFMRFVSAVCDDDESTIFTFVGKHGARVNGGKLSVSLIRSSCDPDPFPENYAQKIDFFITVGNAGSTYAKRNADKLLSPVAVVSVPKNGDGKLKNEGGLCKYNGKSVVSSVRGSENGKLVFGIYNPSGIADKSELVFEKTPKKAIVTDVRGVKTDDMILINGKGVEFNVPPYAYLTIETEFENE